MSRLRVIATRRATLRRDMAATREAIADAGRDLCAQVSAALLVYLATRLASRGGSRTGRLLRLASLVWAGLRVAGARRP